MSASRLAVICGGCWFWPRKLSHKALPNYRTGALRWRAKRAVGRGYWPHREMGQMGRWASGDDGNGFGDDEPEQASETDNGRPLFFAAQGWMIDARPPAAVTDDGE
jgi:hypothetical protein